MSVGSLIWSFLKNHTGEIWACDVLQLYDALFRPIFAFFIVNHGTREVVHFDVTRCPAAAASRLVSGVGSKVVALPLLGGLHHDYQLAA